MEARKEDKENKTKQEERWLGIDGKRVSRMRT